MFRRKLFYLSGFDPRGPRFYHRLHREALARRAELAGEANSVTPCRRDQDHVFAWTVETESTRTVCSFLAWDDLVRKSWLKPGVRLWGRAMVAYYGYLRQASPVQMWRLKPEFSIVLWYPLVVALLLPLLAAMALIGIGLIFLPIATGWLLAFGGLGAGVLVAMPVLERINALWLIRSCIYKDAVAREGFDEATLARLDHFAEVIADALRDGDEDEVLLVGHSSGAVMAVPLLLRLIERCDGRLPAHFTLVTLGHCLPLLSARLDATAYHDMMRQLSTEPFDWIDIGMQADAAGFHGIDPFLPLTQHGAVRLSLSAPKLAQFWSEKSCSAGWHNKYGVHFAYLRCGDSLSPIDFPSLTVAPRRAAEQAVAFRMIEQHAQA